MVMVYKIFINACSYHVLTFDGEATLSTTAFRAERVCIERVCSRRYHISSVVISSFLTMSSL